jgi:hypothetical protein
MGLAFGDIPGLRDIWSARTHRTPYQPRSDQFDRVVFDLLGVGLEQVLQYLGQDAPSFEGFEDWILATAGQPDGEAVARYKAALAGAPLPPSVQARLDAIEAAPAVLGPAELAQWESEGFVILRNALTRDEAQAAEQLLWRVIGLDQDNLSNWRPRNARGIMIQHFQDPALEVARRSPRVHKAFAQLWGTADLWPSVDRMSFNPPEAFGLPFQGPHLHWDVSLALPIPFATQGILYLTDTAADQGALQVVPGFHRRIEAWLDDLGNADPRQVDLSAEAVTIPANAGDLVIWRQDLPHGASPNRTSRPRMAQYVNFYSATTPSHPVWR